MHEPKLNSQPMIAIKDKLDAWLSILLDSSVIAVPIFLTGLGWRSEYSYLP